MASEWQSTMRFLFSAIVLLIALPWIVTFACVGYSFARKNAGWPRCFGVVGAALATVGGVGFFGTALASLGMFNWLPHTFEWPMGYVQGVAATNDGIHVVPHSPSSRIQVYDGNWEFRTGWFVDGRSGPIKVSHVEENEIEVAANHSRHVFTYDVTGQLISSSPYTPKDYDDFPDVGVPRFVPTPIWLLAFSHPFASIAVGICGIVLLAKAGTTPSCRKAAEQTDEPEPE